MSSDKEEQMKKIYDSILFSTDSSNKKKGVKTLAGYGKKAIQQQLRNIETNEAVKNYMFDTITQIEKHVHSFCMSF